MILCALELEILSELDFYDSHFEKWPEPIFRTNFFSGNISNIIPRIPLNKMVQFLDSSGGGGGARWPLQVPGLLMLGLTLYLLSCKAKGSSLSAFYK